MHGKSDNHHGEWEWQVTDLDEAVEDRCVVGTTEV